MRYIPIIIFLAFFLVRSAFSQSPTLAGCSIFPADNPWNLDISKYPVHPNSDGFINAISEEKLYLHADFGSDSLYGIPYTVVDSTQPFVQITYNQYGDESDPGPFPIPGNALVEGGWNAPSNSDRHVLVVDNSNCMLYEFWQAFKDQTGSGWTMANGAKFDLTKNEYRPDGWTSGDAAGLPIMPGLVKYEEVAKGAINHAVRFTAFKSQKGWIHPARHEAGGSDTHYPPMGLRVRLKVNYDISNVTGQSKIILQALKKYGMILADNGSSWFISGTSNPNWDDNDLNQLKKIPGSAFEAVYTGPIKTSPSSITITNLTWDDTLVGGGSFVIHCTTSGVDTIRTLFYSLDEGYSWHQGSGISGTNTFTWTPIPDTSTFGNSAKIRISDGMANYAANDGLFTIASKTKPYPPTIYNVHVGNLTPSDHILTGTSTSITWSSQGATGKLQAEYSTDNINWTLIANMIDSSSHSLPWIIPAPAPAVDVRVRSMSDISVWGRFGPFAIDGVSTVSENAINSLNLSNFPNPVSGKTDISFTLPKTEFVTLKLYNAVGIEIEALASSEMETGSHSIHFDAHSLLDGVYFLRLSAGGETVGREIIVVK